MIDIEFDIRTREIVFKDNDFKLTKNPSVQNGGIILYSSCANPLAPMVGIGILEVIGGNMTKGTFEMNRWQAQALNDGATIASWSAKPIKNDFEVLTKVSYQ